MAGMVAGSLLSPTDPGRWKSTRSGDYDLLLSSLTANDHVVTTIGDKMWVPWYSTSVSCTVNDLQQGSSCDSGQAIDFTHNCMVTDEFSQVGVLVSMGNSERQMDQFFNTVKDIKSSFGSIPAWRIYRNGDKIEQCKQGINGNCDTASDATARIIISLFSASKNQLFSKKAQARYHDLASVLSSDMVTYEVVDQCLPTRFGTVCHWLAAGSRAKQGGMESTDFGYTGYYGDAVIAMLAACKQTGDMSYCGIAKDFALNYLQASSFDGIKFTAPPGRSFKWSLVDGQPNAECTGTCNPVQWDDADAPRAVGICQANYYAKQMGFDIGMDTYCRLWGERYMGDPTLSPVQYRPDGTVAFLQNGYFAQGLQALFQSGGNNPLLFGPTLDSALAHYSTSTNTWDYASCFGVYTQGFAVRALGFGIGRDELVFTKGPDIPMNVTAPDNTTILTNTTAGIDATIQNSSMNISTAVTPNAAVISNASMNITKTTVDISKTMSNVSVNSSDTTLTLNSSNTTIISNTSEISDTSTQDIGPGIARISSLNASCTIQYGVCTPDSDVTSGTCRTVSWSTPRGIIKILGCEKGDAIEVYRQVYPDTAKLEVCLGIGCVDEQKGFDRFTPVYELMDTLPVTDTSSVIDTSTGTLPPTETLPVDKTASNVLPSGAANDLPAISTSPIASLQVSCSSPMSTCWIISDTTDGDCRSLLYGTGLGDIKILSCLKENDYIEVYTQGAPENMEFSVCIDAGCVTKNQGFARVQVHKLPPIGKQGDQTIAPVPASTLTMTTPLTINTLIFTVKPKGTLVGDYMEGSSCRKVQYNTQFGWVEAKACAKDDGSYELYLLSAPNEGSVCIGSSCVGKEGGFVAFTY